MEPTSDKTTLIDSVENALKLGACGVAMRTFIGPKYESEMLRDLGIVSTQCEKLGMPLMSMIYPRGVDNPYDPKYIKYVTRIGAELGAEVVNTYYTGNPETFKTVVDSCPVSVMMAGGEKTEKAKEFLKIVRDVIGTGAARVMVGTNIWESADPTATTRLIVKTVRGTN